MFENRVTNTKIYARWPIIDLTDIKLIKKIKSQNQNANFCCHKVDSIESYSSVFVSSKNIDFLSR
jgi:hypothetical protein